MDALPGHSPFSELIVPFHRHPEDVNLLSKPGKSGG